MVVSPILFIVFNRPDTTAKVFEAIRKARPKQLFVAADGPRDSREGEKDLCARVRSIATAVDWDCELKTLFQPVNLGCGRGVSTAIDWFFRNVEQGILLEDDTVPDPSFFPFCATMLDRYAADERIMHICGSNFQRGKAWGEAPYYLSYYAMIWGWATWRRAWRKYDFDLRDYPKHEGDLGTLNPNLSDAEKQYWKDIFDRMHYGEARGLQRTDTWDYQWMYTCWREKGWSIVPNANLVTNVGFGDSATHTTHLSNVAGLSAAAIGEFQTAHALDYYLDADLRLYRTYFNPPPTVLDQVRDLAIKVLPQSVQTKLREFKRRIVKRNAA